MAGMLVIVFFSGKNAKQAPVNCNCCLCVATGRPCFSSLFLAISTCLSFAGLGWVKLKWILCTVPCKAREVVHSLCSYFPGKGNLSKGYLLALSNAGLGSRIMQAKWNCLPSDLCVIFSDFLFCWSFLRGLQSSRSGVSFVTSYLVVDLCGDTEAGVS